MQPEGSLPWSQEPATGRCPETNGPVHNFPQYLFKIHFNLILPSTSVSSKSSLLFRLFDQNFVFISP
jgi:hypothetical protein